MSNYEQYYQKKPIDKATLAREGNSFIFSFARYDVDTGEPVEPDKSETTLEEMQAVKAELEEKLLAVNTVLSDIKEL